MKTSDKGKKGEERAARYLEGLGYDILARRFRSRAGEVDIVARKGEDLVFVEVKTWDRIGADGLETSVNAAKRDRLRRTGAFFLDCHPELDDCHIRFDLVFLSRRMGKLDHWENAF